MGLGLSKCFMRYALMFFLWETTLSMIQATCGAILATFRPQSPAIIPSPNTVFDGIVATKSDVAFGVPSFIEVFQLYLRNTKR